ncbi:MAG: prolipoprotein diacylglyceryl transferase family protein [bacterium]
MYPELYSFTFGDTAVPITAFGVSLTIAFFLFYWMLRRLGRKYDINTAFFSENLLSFFLVTFFISRFLHVILYAGLPTKSAFSIEYPILTFFLMSDYYFSAGGAILAFFGLFWFHMRHREQEDCEDVLDLTVISWVFASIVAYFGAFLGGQVYGVRNEGIFAVDYINNPILAEFPRFPLAIVYVLCTLAIFSLIYIVRKVRPER